MYPLTQKEIDHMEIVEQQLRLLNKNLSRIADGIESLTAVGKPENEHKEEQK